MKYEASGGEESSCQHVAYLHIYYLLSTAVAGLSHTNTDISVSLLSSALCIHTRAVTKLHLNTAVGGHLTSHQELVVSLNPFYLFYDTHNPNLS